MANGLSGFNPDDPLVGMHHDSTSWLDRVFANGTIGCFTGQLVGAGRAAGKKAYPCNRLKADGQNTSITADTVERTLITLAAIILIELPAVPTEVFRGIL